MTTSPELEKLKNKISEMKPSVRKSDKLYQALQMWTALQTNADLVALVTIDRVKKSYTLNQGSIASAISGSRNIFRKERFRLLLEQLNDHARANGVFEGERPISQSEELDKRSTPSDAASVSNPIEELAFARLEAKLAMTEEKLKVALQRVKELERHLTLHDDKFT